MLKFRELPKAQKPANHEWLKKQKTHTTAEWESLAEPKSMKMRIPRKLENVKNRKVRASQKERCMYFQSESQQFSYLVRFDISGWHGTLAERMVFSHLARFDISGWHGALRRMPLVGPLQKGPTSWPLVYENSWPLIKDSIYISDQTSNVQVFNKEGCRLFGCVCSWLSNLGGPHVY